MFSMLNLPGIGANRRAQYIHVCVIRATRVLHAWTTSRVGQQQQPERLLTICMHTCNM